MSNLCEKIISACIAADCDNPLYAGVKSTAYIFNKSQIASVTKSGNTISGITMGNDGAAQNPVTYCAYTVQQLGNKPFDGSQTEMVEGTYGNRFNHTVQLAIVDNGPDICKNIVDSLANGSFCVILENEYVHTNGDNKYQCYGFDKGLKASSITREVWGDNESAYIVTLVEEGAPTSGKFFYVTDESTTDAAVKALLCVCA